MSYVLLFLIAVILDLLYVLWVRSIAEKTVLPAMMASMAIGACSLSGVTAVVDDRAAAIPWLLGLAVGTWLGMYLEGKEP